MSQVKMKKWFWESMHPSIKLPAARFGGYAPSRARARTTPWLDSMNRLHDSIPWLSIKMNMTWSWSMTLHKNDSKQRRSAKSTQRTNWCGARCRLMRCEVQNDTESVPKWHRWCKIDTKTGAKVTPLHVISSSYELACIMQDDVRIRNAE
jgi:hypothetical protein